MSVTALGTTRGNESGRLRRLCGWLGVTGPLAFATASVLATAAQRGYSPRREDISALAALDAQAPWIMITGFLVFGSCTVALALGLRSAIQPSQAGTAGPIMLLVVGVGIVAVGLMRNDCSTELARCAARVRAGSVSWHHHGHDLASITVFTMLMFVPLVFAEAFRNDSRWLGLRRYCQVSGPLSFALFVLYIFSSSLTGGWSGLFQRLFTAAVLTWIGVLGVRLARPSPHRDRCDPALPPRVASTA